MKNRFILLFLLAAVVSCGPSRHSIHVEMRHPSKAGIDLSGKTVSVVYMENRDSVSAEFNGYMADGFAYALEQEYGIQVPEEDLPGVHTVGDILKVIGK